MKIVFSGMFRCLPLIRLLPPVQWSSLYWRHCPQQCPMVLVHSGHILACRNMNKTNAPVAPSWLIPSLPPRRQIWVWRRLDTSRKDECLLATHRAGLCHDCKSGQVVFFNSALSAAKSKIRTSIKKKYGSSAV